MQAADARRERPGGRGLRAARPAGRRVGAALRHRRARLQTRPDARAAHRDLAARRADRCAAPSDCGYSSLLDIGLLVFVELGLYVLHESKTKISG